MSGPQIPPPPPAPTALDGKAAREQMQELRKVRRRHRKERAVSTLQNVHPSIWAAAGVGVVVLGAVVFGARWWSGQAEFQRDTAIALAGARGEAPATSQPPVVQGMENPLETMKLTTQARWLIGPTADGAGLLPGRSTLVVRQILESGDACSLFISLDADNLPRVSKQPGAGAVPLVDCAKPATSTPTTSTPTVREGE